MFDNFDDDFLFFLAEQWPLCVSDPFVPNNPLVNNVRNLSHGSFQRTSSVQQACLDKHWMLVQEVQLNVVATLQNGSVKTSRTSAVIELTVPVEKSSAVFQRARFGVRQYPEFQDQPELSRELQEHTLAIASGLQVSQDARTWPTLTFDEPVHKKEPCQKGHPQRVPKEGCDPCDVCCQCQLKNSCDGACRSCECLCEPLQRMSPKQLVPILLLFGIFLYFLLA